MPSRHSRPFFRLGKESRVIAGMVVCVTVIAAVLVAVQTLSRPRATVFESSALPQSVPESALQSGYSSKPEESSLPDVKEEPVYEPETRQEIKNLYEANAKERQQTAAHSAAVAAPVSAAVSVGTRIADVPFISQTKLYLSGCESVSAVMACQHAGIAITVEDFIDLYLPRASFRVEGDTIIGYHPSHYFMGDPYTLRGFGCYAPCIETAIRKFLPAGFALKNTTGTSLAVLCRDYIDQGIPVMVWATMYMKAPTQGQQWILEETGEMFQWIGGEHCLVLTGYDDQYYYFNDPLAGQVRYVKSVVNTRFSELGSQSLVVYASDEEPEDPVSVDEPSAGGDGSDSSDIPPPDSTPSEVDGKTSSDSGDSMPESDVNVSDPDASSATDEP